MTFPRVQDADDWVDTGDGRYRLLAGGPADDVRRTYGMLVVPRKWRLIRVQDYPGFCPGGLELATASLLEKAALYPVRVMRDGAGYVIDGGVHSAHRVPNEKAAVWSLVSEHGLRAIPAAETVRAAHAHGTASMLVKYAEGYRAPDMHELDSVATYNDEAGVPVVEPAQRTTPVDGLQEEYATPETYQLDPVVDRQTRAVEQAAASGEKEVMDVGVLAALVKSLNVDDYNEKYLRDLTRGLDRVGRLLFLYYWHYDKYAERYGDDEMQELEDALRNTFSAVGDTVLFMKKRSVEPDRALQGSDVDLGGVAGNE